MTKLGRCMVLLLVFFMLVSCTQLGTTGSGKPTWLDRGYDATYDEATYLCAVGSGSNRERAVDSALSSLSQVFNAQVRSLTEVTSLSSRETDAAGNVTFAESSEMVESGSVASQTGNIIGAEVVGTYIDDFGRVYVRVALHRKRTAQLYKNRIAELAASLSQARTKSALASDSLRSYLLLLQAKSLVREQQSLYDQLQVLLQQPQRQVLLGYERELAVLAEKIQVSVKVVSDDASTPVLQAAFEKGLQDFGFRISKQEEGPVLLVVYDVEPLQMADSPYQYARYSLSVQLMQGNETYVSYKKVEREAALSQVDAVAKALRSAGNSGVEEFFSLMLTTLGDET